MGQLVDSIEDFGQPITGRERVANDAIEAGIERISSAAPSKYHRHPLPFLQECVWTRDEADPEMPVKQFPTRACRTCKTYYSVHQDQCATCSQPPEPLFYIEHLVNRWFQADPNVLLVPKPRRFKISWLFAALHTWLALSRRESAVYFQSRTEEEAKLLLERVEFILENIPASKLKVPNWHTYSRPPKLELSNGSFIHGKPEGKDALRSVTASAIFLDEIAFWKDARGSWQAIKPLIEKGCRCTVVSTAYPGFWEALVTGEL